MNILSIIIGISLVLIAVILLLSRRELTFPDSQFVIKRRGGVIIQVQQGGSIKKIPLIDDIVTVNINPIEITLDKEIISGEEDQVIPIVGRMVFKLNNLESKLDEIEFPKDGDINYRLKTKLKSDIHDLIRIDLWGMGRIDLMKNEKRILNQLVDNIKYNLPLSDTEIQELTLNFRF